MEGAQNGLPTALAYNTLNQFSEKETLALNVLEQQVLGISNLFVPLQTSYTQSGSSDTGGAPTKDSTESQTTEKHQKIRLIKLNKRIIIMDNKKFIITTNDESASLLIQTGFHLVSQNGKQWTFLNDNKMLFNNLSDVVYSDKLFI